jgi:hypothetical protein
MVGCPAARSFILSAVLDPEAVYPDEEFSFFGSLSFSRQIVA